MVKALIFNGTGVGQTCLPRTTDALIKYNIPFATSTKINKDTLKGYNVLFLPGGDSAYKLYITNKNINSTDIKAWIKAGGVVIATCSGAYASVNNVDGLYRAFGFAPNVNAKVYSENGVETVQFTTQGQKVFKKGTTLKMSHEAGPALYLPPGPGKEVLAIYNTGSFKGYGAIVVDGNVGLFSPHPELNPYYPDMIVNLMNYLLKKNEGNDVMGNIDTKYDYMIKKADFKLMIEGVANWLKSHSNKPPVTVYLRVNGVKSLTNYVSYAKYVEMKKKWDNFIKLNKREPAYVTPRPSAETITPTPTPSTLGPIQTKIQQGTGKKWTTFTEFYNLVLKYCTYSYYFDDNKTLAQEISAIISSFNGKDIGQNCVDYASLGEALAREMKYVTRFIGIYCTTDRINHAYFEIKGKEFKDWTAIDLAAAASDSYKISSHWCSGAKTVNPSWVPKE